jgi:hypothetical protein
MWTIFWNLHGLHLRKVFEKVRKFNKLHHITEILSTLFKWHVAKSERNDWILIFHVNDIHRYIAMISLQFIEQNKTKIIFNPSYSPDFAPADYVYLYLYLYIWVYLYLYIYHYYVKKCLKDYLFADAYEFLWPSKAFLRVFKR